jgi:hypothetical protein
MRLDPERFVIGDWLRNGERSATADRDHDVSE